MRWLPFARAEAPRRPDWLTARPFAHRGLHGAGRVENSRAAFGAALAAGHGIELDVQASADGAAFVFHDSELDRLCNARGRLADLGSEEAATVAFRAGGESLPRLDEIFALIGGRTPVLVEIKAQRRGWRQLCTSVRCTLQEHPGPAAIMSFDPKIVRWFARHAPGTIRGLVVSEEKKRNLRGWFERHLAVRLGQPDFLAYDIRSLPSRFAARARQDGLALLSWTVRSRADADKAALHADQIIHELPAAE
jgi:glycerophosphoryl diester phosphodiesterase